MAGDWFPARVWLTKAHEVVWIAERTGLSPQAVAGHLTDLWSFATENTTDGFLRGLNVSALVRAIGAEDALWRAVVEVGWLVFDDAGMRIPNWEFWLSQSAKKRLKDSRRKKLRRAGRVRVLSAKCPRSVREMSAPKRDKSGTTVQESIRGMNSPKTPSCPEPAEDAAPAIPPVLTFPTNGTGAKEWHLSAAKLAEYAEAFPGIDVLAECRKALQWIRDNPSKRKTPRGMPAFLGKWLGRAQNDAGRFGTPSQPNPLPKPSGATGGPKSAAPDPSEAEAAKRRRDHIVSFYPKKPAPLAPPAESTETAGERQPERPPTAERSGGDGEPDDIPF